MSYTSADMPKKPKYRLGEKARSSLCENIRLGEVQTTVGLGVRTFSPCLRLLWWWRRQHRGRSGTRCCKAFQSHTRPSPVRTSRHPQGRRDAYFLRSPGLWSNSGRFANSCLRLVRRLPPDVGLEHKPLAAAETHPGEYSLTFAP